MDRNDELAVLLASRVPIIVVETRDEERLLALLVNLAGGVAAADHRPLFRWTVTDGLQRIDVELAPQLHNAPPDQVLRHIRTVDKPGIYVLLDFHPYLGDPVNIRLLKDAAVGGDDIKRTILLVSHAVTLPDELASLSARFELALPDEAERRALVQGVAQQWSQEHGQRVKADAKALAMLVENLAGLDRASIERLARHAIHCDGAISSSDLPAVMAAKYELLNQDGVLSYEYDLAGFDDIGGLASLKRWIDQRRAVLLQPDSRLDPPKGLLLLGVQGCGKSLAARATAGALSRPLLRLDFGTLYNKYHGETERNLRAALTQAELMSPCVLWIDELEKGLATGDSDSGTSRRVLGTFLTWLAEQSGTVFVVATANDIQALPPELVRKGRFDEIFFVDLPGPAARQSILAIQLRQREIDPAAIDVERLAEVTDGFSGAEIEQGVIAALYAAHARQRDLATGDLLAEYMRTRPLSVVMAEQVGALRAWAEQRCVSAD